MLLKNSFAVSRSNFLPFALPSIGEEEIAEVVDSLRSGWITTGPKVKLFEDAFAQYVGTPYAIAVSSCTAALHIALTALGVGPGDEVIVPTLTFCASANVVVHLGARPVLIDVGEDFNVTPEAVERAITPRTKAVMLVHYSGQACELKALYEVARRHNLAVIEDAAHATGAEYRGMKIGDARHSTVYGSERHVVCFSFYAIKNLTTGEGGLIATADGTLAERMRLLTLHGMNRDAWKRYMGSESWFYEVLEPGYKCNMTDIQASLGIHQLKKLDGFIETRARYARLYTEVFRDIPEVETPLVHPTRTHAWHLYVIRLALERMTIDRAQFIEALRIRNIGTSVHFIPVHLHPYYQKQYRYRHGDLKQAEYLYDRIVSLPLYPGMTEDDVHDVIDSVQAVTSAYRR
ncbi:MAG: Aminotransferase, DegT/DnrJ/EryC1/StrS family [Nitrospira sp.]|jgi:dTDP-4-amino-4,6-dideoxygalactose transaminase|nr:MAG: Aminotransferase, DegT/DnrJ/EryC1/StrS family [Nitrospira sp.]